MPVYPLRFTRWEGERQSTAWSWWHLARTSLATLRWNRPLRILRALWFFYTALFFVLVYVAERGSIFGFSLDIIKDQDVAPFITHTATRLSGYLMFPAELLILVIFALFSGAGLLADDRRTGAIGLYLSKPVTRVQYLLSRISVVAIFIGTFSVLPAFCLLLFEVLIARNTLDALKDLRLVPGLLLVWVVYTVLFGLSILVLSSLTERGRTAGVIFIVLWFMSDFAGLIVDALAGWGWGTVFDLDRLCMGTVSALLRPKAGAIMQEFGNMAPPAVAFGAVATYALLFLWILWVRTRPTGGNR